MVHYLANENNMRLTIVSTSDFFSDYGGGEIYVRGIVDELINRKNELELELSVISYGQGKFENYNGIQLFKVNNRDSFKSALLSFKTNIIHANGLFDLAIPIGHELGIPVVSTVHDAMFICPMYTLLDEHDHLCRKPMDFKRCLKCTLYRLKGGRIIYPFLKRLEKEKIIEWGISAEKRPFIFFYSPIILSALGIDRKQKYWENYLCESDIMVLPSVSMTKMAIINGANPNKVITIPNGINPSKYSVKAPTRGTIDFYYIGRISYSKGVHILLSAFHCLSSEKARLHIIGLSHQDSGNKYIVRLKKKYNNDSRIIWHYKIKHNEIYDFLKDYHVMVQPSIANETFSLTVAEAKAMGKYVIATKCGGPEEQIINGENGILINPNDINALAVAMQDYIDNPIIPKPCTLISISKHIDLLLRLYQSVIISQNPS